MHATSNVQIRFSYDSKNEFKREMYISNIKRSSKIELHFKFKMTKKFIHTGYDKTFLRQRAKESFVATYTFSKSGRKRIIFININNIYHHFSIYL